MSFSRRVHSLEILDCESSSTPHVPRLCKMRIPVRQMSGKVTVLEATPDMTVSEFKKQLRGLMAYVGLVERLAFLEKGHSFFKGFFCFFLGLGYRFRFRIWRIMAIF